MNRWSALTLMFVCSLSIIYLADKKAVKRGNVFKHTINSIRPVKFGEKVRQNRNATKIIRMMNGYKASLRRHELRCGQYRCIRETGGKDFFGADILTFNEHAVSHFVLPPVKRKGTLWAFDSMEAHNHILINQAQLKRWDGYFNYSATYLSTSPGNLYSFRDEIIPITTTATNFAKKYSARRPRALWFVSHCLHRWKKHSVLSGRVEYIQELSNHISIDAFTRKKGCREQLGSLIKNRAEPKLSEYTFYLSFESTNCRDYISEKFWKVLEADGQTIPVALGGLSIEEYERVAPPNSFIHVKNFTSPKALAQHLKFVADDDRAFNYYHRWRNEYQLKNTKRGKNPVADFNCYFCELAHTRPYGRWTTFSQDFSSSHCLNLSTPDAHCKYYNLSCSV